MEQHYNEKGRFVALLPFIVFVLLFASSSVLFTSQITPITFCMIALFCALFTFKEQLSLNKKMEIFIRGTAHDTVLTMIFIFIFSAVFTYVMKEIGGTAAAVKIGLYILPHAFILPGFFTIVSLFATAIGTSMGAIAAFLPIGIGIAASINVDPAFMAGLVVGGAMLGDNLSIISDTTIAATQTTHTTMRDKFYANFKLVIPAFLLTFLTLYWFNAQLPSTVMDFGHGIPTWCDGLHALPYGIVFLFALIGLDVIAVLVLGIVSAAFLGYALGDLTSVQTFNIILDGFVNDAGGIQEVLILALLVAGLSHVVEYNGGIAYILKRFSRHITTQGGAELCITALVFVVNAAVAINTIAILITGPVAHRVAQRFKIAGKRTASILDITACICQGILPYAPQLLLAGSLAGVSSISIMPYLYYQWFTALILAGSIGHVYLKKA